MKEYPLARLPKTLQIANMPVSRVNSRVIMAAKSLRGNMAKKAFDHNESESTGPSATVNPSYQWQTPFVLTDSDRKAIAWAFGEIDMEQIKILRTKTPAQRAQQAVSMMNAAEQVAAYRLRQREPELTEKEALRIVRRGLLNYELRKRRR
jgi:hypothetical protein